MIDYSIFFNKVLTDQGFDVVAEYNCFDVGYDQVHGWPLKLPNVDFGPRTLLLLHFQDFVTATDQGILELLQVEQHYADRADQVLVTHWPHNLSCHYNGPVNLIEFNSHEYAIIQHLKQRQAEWIPCLQTVRSQAWQSLNGRECAHRTRVSNVIADWPNGILAYGDRIPLESWPYSTYPGTENEDNFVRLAEIYGSCAVNIVTETQYDRAPGIITEKTIFAMLSKQIPVVIGYPGIVQDCVDLGFDMFTDLVDTSYDTAPNHCRVEMALQTNKDLILGHRDLAPYAQRLKCQQEFVLEHYPRLLKSRFMTSAESLFRARQGIA
jgi:hypothetical protein